MVKLLLGTSGINLDARDSNGLTALMYAANGGYLEVRQYFMLLSDIDGPLYVDINFLITPSLSTCMILRSLENFLPKERIVN